MFSLAERRAGRRPGAEGITYTHTLTEVPIHGLAQQAPTSCQICATQCNFWCNAAYLTRSRRAIQWMNPANTGRSGFRLRRVDGGLADHLAHFAGLPRQR